eukprot:TRINITY_DN81262_c0_g1_i1.p1 TRINITY_DN81262_c0_g1~~TRINITY_DN81262_c0_g1_i1.p1  ORF type:complete len:387 (-),score=49.20 TRINITY_DN81262_c0_g1_i1:290-1450(-)
MSLRRGPGLPDSTRPFGSATSATSPWWLIAVCLLACRSSQTWIFSSCFPSIHRDLTACDATATDLPLPPPRTFKELRAENGNVRGGRWRTFPKLKTNQKHLHYNLAGCKDVNSVLKLVEGGRVENWSAVNLVTAWHRLAKALRGLRSRTEMIRQRVAVAERRLEEAVDNMGPDAFGGRELGNLIYAWGISQSKTRLLKHFCRNAAFRLREMGPQGVANSIYALGLLGYQEELFLTEVGKALPGRVANFRPEEITQMVQGFGHLKFVPEGGLLEALCEHIESHLREFSATEQSCILFALARLNFKDERLLNALCGDLEKRIWTFDNRQVVRMLDSMAKLRIRHSGIVMAFSTLVAGRIPALNRERLLVRVTQDLQSLQAGLSSREVG